MGLLLSISNEEIQRIWRGLRRLTYSLRTRYIRHKIEAVSLSTRICSLDEIDGNVIEILSNANLTFAIFAENFSPSWVGSVIIMLSFGEFDQYSIRKEYRNVWNFIGLNGK